MANESFEKVLETIKDQDSTALKSMFSPKALAEAENIDQSIIMLFDFFQGEFISYDDHGGAVGGDGLFEDNKQAS